MSFSRATDPWVGALAELGGAPEPTSLPDRFVWRRSNHLEGYHTSSGGGRVVKVDRLGLIILIFSLINSLHHASPTNQHSRWPPQRFGHGSLVTEHVLPVPMHRLAPNEKRVSE